uniref:Uncharacterized protein n=1 Tax=Kalanchoe fedtschenkoi TaxID=63787 RepID=A0A7N0RFU2_KALFE
MPLTKTAADAFGVVTICLVSLLTLVGFVCILYSIYFRSRVRCQGFSQLCYFSGPWIIRITFILFAIWWGIGEVIRLNFWRLEGRVLNHLDSKWEETICKGYIVSNMGFAEPCLLLILVFLLRAPLLNTGSGTLSQKWNGKTAIYVFLFCFPMLVLQLIVIIIGPKITKDTSHRRRLPEYFTRSTSSIVENNENLALCTYPLLSTIVLGLFATILTLYLFWLGRQILHLVINKGLQKRVYTLILSVSGFLLLRVLLLGLSVLSRPKHFLFEMLAFFAFVALLCCVGVCICMLVYRPVADSLALGASMQDMESGRGNNADTISLIANPILFEGSFGNNRTSSVDELQSFVELTLFSESHHN